ncbi:hypothetical protein NT6N_23960 [Oceaniferula spumae]|uniref:Uncharacterized protein n=1 Tax=Oceaniferula spumae TaxID=2979115 RepID=A0AAT9FMY7_9BACT
MPRLAMNIRRMLLIFWRHPQERGLPEDGQYHAKPSEFQSACDYYVLPSDGPLPETIPCMMITSRHGRWIKPAAT